MAASEIDRFAPEARFSGIARLPGFRLELRRRSIRWSGGAADIVERAGHQVWGVLYELPGDALGGLDGKEGAGFAYRRREVEVEGPDGARRAFAYEVIDKEPEEVPPSAEYVALLLEAARSRGLPAGYVEGLGRLDSVS
jgi:cation transport regulator ChaC